MKDINTIPETETSTILEQHQRLSQSQLWKLQRTFYEQRGIRAWSQDTTPHYLTSNPFIANAYGKVVFGFLRDWHTFASASLDTSQPVYIIELGAGSGRFSYYFLKKFMDFFTRSALKEIPIKYVMTDFSEQNLAFWQQHPSLQAFIEQGILDFAYFDVTQPQELMLRHAKTVLSSATIKNPLVLLANYIFDSIPQDCFMLKDGQLHESLVTLSSSKPEPDLNDPALLYSLKPSYDHYPINADYYNDPDFNQVLHSYQQQFPNTTFLFPHVALRCLHFFRDLSGGRLLLLSGDQGYSQEEDLQSRRPLSVGIHSGAFSMMVNYHAIGEYVRNQGGQVLHMAHRHSWLHVSAYLLGQHPTDYLETAQSFHEAIEQWGPDDFFTFFAAITHKATMKAYDALSLSQLLAWLRLSGWDCYSFLAFFPFLLKKLETSSKAELQALYQVIQHIWDTYYHIGEKRDLAYALGILLYNMKYSTEALDFFQRSLELYGPHQNTFYYMAKCHSALQRTEDALACLDQMLQLHPSFEPAQAIRLELQSQLQPNLRPEAAF